PGGRRGSVVRLRRPDGVVHSDQDAGSASGRRRARVERGDGGGPELSLQERRARRDAAAALDAWLEGKRWVLEGAPQVAEVAGDAGDGGLFRSRIAGHRAGFEGPRPPAVRITGYSHRGSSLRRRAPSACRTSGGPASCPAVTLALEHPLHP